MQLALDECMNPTVKSYRCSKIPLKAKQYTSLDVVKQFFKHYKHTLYMRRIFFNTERFKMVSYIHG